MVEPHRYCRNCDAPLGGEYCSRCGQRERGADLTFGQIAGELAHDVFSWDSRLWRTLVPLLFRPGFLTAEFIAGRRARYVAPFRLYLIISFILFVVVAALPGESIRLVVNDDPVIGAETVLAGEDSPQWLRELDRRMQNNMQRSQDNPTNLMQSLLEYLPQMMFLLLPVFALLLSVCYLFSPYHYLQHLVFSLHFHSFAYVLYLAGVVVDAMPGTPLSGDYLLWLLPLYLPLALGRTYGSGLAGALGKSLFILLADGVALLLAFSLLVLVVLAVM